jgi:hypothetical protein
MALAVAATAFATRAQTPGGGADVSPEVSAPALPSPSPSTTPGVGYPTVPAPEAVELPAMVEPTGAPVASTTRHGVRVELWPSPREVGPGTWLEALVVATNTRPDRVWTRSSRCEGSATDVALDLSPVVDPGISQPGNAGALKQLLIDRSGVLRSAFDPVAPEASMSRSLLTLAECVWPDRRSSLRPGARRLERFAWYAATSLDGGAFVPLPPGTVPVTVTWPYLGHGARTTPHPRPITLRAAVTLTGDGPGTPSVPQLIDHALADPGFGAWVAADPTRATWSGEDLVAWPGPELPAFSPFSELGTLPPRGVVSIELDQVPASRSTSQRGIVVLDPLTGEVLGFATQ